MRKVYALLFSLACFASTRLLAQNVTVNPGAGSYATLKAAFDAINAGTHTGSITVDIVGNTTETAIAALNASGSGSASYTSILISPSGGSGRTISGSLASEIINLNGADNVTFDGLNSGGNSLTISNTSTSATSGTSTIRFSNDATNNTITKCSILGSATMAVGTNGGNIFFHTAASGGTGNDNNTISNCDIGPAGSNLPTKGVYSSGTTTASSNYNSDITITGNNIFDFFGAATTSAGVYLAGGTTDWTITNNRLFQTATRTQTTGGIHAGIQIASANVNNCTISGNILGYSSAAGTGTYTISNGATSGLRFYPIYLSSHGTTTATSISNNTVTAITISGAHSGTTTSAPFIGIGAISGFSTITNNTVGSLDGSTTISYSSTSATTHDVYGIYHAGSGGVINIANNNVGTISLSDPNGGIFFNGIRGPQSSTVTAVIEGNVVGGTAADNINNGALASSTANRIVGIQAALSLFTINNNTVRNMTVSSASTSTTTSASVIGIMQSSTATGASFVISNNTVHSLSNTNSSAVASSVIGIYNTGTTTVSANTYTLFNNHVYSLTNASTSTTATLYGIYQAAGQYVLYNNRVRLGRDATGSSLTNDIIIKGIYDAATAATTKLYFNSVFVGGQGVTASVANTYAFESLSTAAREYKNNIFYNARSNAAGTGSHYAIKVAGTGVNPAGLTSNRNDLYADGTGGILGFYDASDRLSLAGWQSATGVDANSYRTDPRFVNQVGSAITGSLKIVADATPNPLESGAEAITGITTDFEGDARPGPAGSVNGGASAPDVGADEFDGAPAVPMVYQSSNAVQETGTAFAGGNNQTILRIDVTTTGSASPLLVSQFTLNANGTTNISDLTNARIYYTGASSTFGTNLPFGATVPTLANYTISGSQALIEGTNYFWLVYDVAPGAAQGNVVDAELIDITINSATQTPTTSAPAGNKLIVGPMSGNYNVGVGQSFPNFVTITEAVANLHGRGVNGPVTLTLTNNAATPYDVTNGEEFPITINEITGAGSTNTITIKPGAAVTPVISGLASAVFKLNGADYITFDGSNSGGTDRSLTISNTSTATATTGIWLGSLGTAQGATNITIKNCIVETGTLALVTYGIYVGNATSITTTGTGADNNNLTIQNNHIRKATYGIYLRGVPTTGEVTGLNITRNTIGSNNASEYITDYGMQIYSVVAPSITRNEIFNLIANNTKYGIYMGTNISNAVISRNNIHSFGYTNTTAYVTHGISFPNNTALTNNQIDNNIIYDLRSYGTTTSTTGPIGIRVAGGDGFKIYFNTVSLTDTIGSATAAVLSHCFMVSTASTNLDVRNNLFYNARVGGNSPKNYAIYTVSGTTYSMINNNSYFTSGAALGYIGGTERSNLAAIQTGTGMDGNSISTDPMLNGPTNVKPGVGSPVIGAGDNSTGISTDYLDVTRNDPPTIGAYEQAVDAAGPIITYTQLSNTCSTGDATITATITDGTGVDLNSSLLPRIYFKKNAGAYTSAQGSLASGNKMNGQWNFTISAAALGGLTSGDVISYYIIAQDELGQLSSNPPGAVASNVNTVTTPPAPDTYNILFSLNGVYNVGSAQAAPFNTLTSAVAVYNTACLNGPVTFNLTDATYSTSETFPIVIDANAQASSGKTLTISPASGMAVTITGASGATSGLIKLNGADWIRIDGLNTGGSSLTIENTQTTAGTAAVWISSISAGNGATNNIIRNCNLKGGVAQDGATTNTYGIVIAGATLSTTHTSITAGDDNDNNTIEGNNITKVRYGIFTRGGATNNANAGTVIKKNIIGPAALGADEIGKAGILIREEDGIEISGNEIRFVGGNYANTSVGSDRAGIAMGTDATWSGSTAPTAVFVKNAVIKGNMIHDIVDERTFSAVGILIAATDGANATNNLVANNMIYNILANGTSGDQAVGIAQSAGNGETIVYNSIYMTGDVDPNASASTPTYSSFGMSISTTSVTNPLWRNNIVYMDLTSSSAPALKYAALTVPSSFAWGTGGSDYNDLFAPGVQSNVGSIGGSTGTFANSLGNWQSASSQDAVSVSADPAFVSGINLHLTTGSPAINVGTAITGVTTDYDGQLRDNNPDIGADEYYVASSTITDYFRSITSGNWTAYGTFESSPVSDFTSGVVSPATYSPDVNSNVISIRNGHTVTVAANVTTDQTFVNPGGALAVTGNLTVLNNGLTIQSSAAGTARIATSSGTISGNVITERYIPASGRRAWRLLGANVLATGAPTIQAAWQEGGVPSAMGTHVTQLGGSGSNGFDASSIATANHSIYAWNGTTLTAPTNTNVTKVTDNGGAYFLFVRGNRNINLNNASANSNTTLRMMGTVNQGPVTAGVAGASFSLIPNPYPSPVDYEAIIAANGGLSGTYYIWDATLGAVGAYRTIVRTGASTYSSTPTTGSDNTMRYIRSGQAFFIPDNMQVNFTEAMKTDMLPAVNVYRPGTGTEEMTIDLKVVDGSGTATLYDGVRAKYNNSFSTSVDNNDAPKLNNFNENLSIVRDNKTLAIETRPLIDASDTIFLKLWNTGVKNYQFDINPANFSTTAGLEAKLVDNYLQTQTPVSLSNNTTYNFSITSDANTAAPDRFMIVFRSAAPLPVNFTNVKAFQKNSGIQVEWNVGTEQDVVKYEVEKSTNGTTFEKANTTTANNSKAYAWFDANPVQGGNFYRIKVINKDNSYQYSQVVNVKIDNGAGDIAVYPNPVKGGVINVQLTNLEKGTYSVQLINSLGQQVYSGRIIHNGGSSSQSLQLANALSKGVYQLVLTNGDNKMTQQVIAE